MKRWLLLSVALLVCAAVIILLNLSRKSDEEAHRIAKETHVLVGNLAGASLHVMKSGTSWTDSTAVVLDNPGDFWLQPGNYFLRADWDRQSHYFPIPVLGYSSGPDEDGAFVITVRTHPETTPPQPVAGMDPFVFIPAGSFLLGDRLNPREPHYVWLTSFFIAPFEITNEEFRRFMSAPNGYKDDMNWTEAGRRWRAENSSRCTALLTPGHSDYQRFGSPDQPVTWVNWFEAHAYCTWLTRTLGDRRWWYTLPTEAEWEKAARGPDGLDYALGMSISDKESGLYNWKKNPWEDTTVVGIAMSRMKYRSNRYGLYHMTGNVVEWTSSVSRPYNRQIPYVDDDRNHATTAGVRIARGGSWYSASIAYVYIPYRDSFQPEHSTQELGFRIAVRALP